MHLAEQGNAFLQGLALDPALRGGGLVLVGHSLGGLVIKTAMVHAATFGDENLEGVLRRVAGVVFIGTPHQGSSLASIAALVGGLLRTNPQVVNMKADDPALQTLNTQFRNVVSLRAVPVQVYYETRGVLIGRNIFKFRLGKSVVVVDRNSSDPQLPGVTPVPLELDHIQIAKPRTRKDPLHTGVLTFLRTVSQAPNTVAMTRGGEADLLSAQARLASLEVLNWPSTLPGGAWIHRPELEQVLTSCAASETSITLLLGEPGCGKSALLSRASKRKIDDGWSVLAVKADRLPDTCTDAEALRLALGLPVPVAQAVQTMAAHGPVLLVIDQLDALADLVVQHSARLRVLLEVIQTVAGAKNVHVLASCRTFEHRHDPALRNLEAQAVTLQLPPWSLIEAELQARGVAPGAWNVELQEVLRSPHALDLFLRLLGGAGETHLLRSFQALLQEQWTREVVLADPSGGRKAALLEIANEMAAREVLVLPSSLVEHRGAQITALVAAGVLRQEPTGRIEFRHQTLYEFVRAKTLLEEPGSLTSTVLRGQSSLRIRPQLWHALGYFRETSPESYCAELQSLWCADLRTHLRLLVIEFLGKQQDPLPSEIAFIHSHLGEDLFRSRFVTAAAGSRGWFAILARDYLAGWMTAAPEALGSVARLLEMAISSNADDVVRLLGAGWLQDPQYDALSFRVLALGNAVPAPGAWMDAVSLLLRRMQLADWAIDHVVSVVSAAYPRLAPALFAHAWHGRVLRVRAIENAEEREQGKSALLGGTLYSLTAVAEAAPEAFVREVWPVYRDVHDVLAGGEASPVRYRGSPGFDPADRAHRSERPLREAMRMAAVEWASASPSDFLAFVQQEQATDLLALHRLLAHALALCAAAHPAAVFDYLREDKRRFWLGSYEDMHRETTALIRAIAPVLTASDYAALEDLLLQWRPYDGLAPDDDAVQRQERIASGRRHRLRLLRALPQERMSTAARNHLREEERAFPHAPDHDVSFSGVHSVGSPVSSAEMAVAADTHIENLFAELPDGTGWDHPRSRFKGGAIQAGTALAELLPKDPAKVLRITRRMRPTVNEIPAGAVVRALARSNQPPQVLFDLVRDLVEMGFNTPGFRSDVGFALEAVVSRETPLPAALLSTVEEWLATGDPGEAEDENGPAAASPEADGPGRASYLWGAPRMAAVPSGSFPLLATLSKAYLSGDPPQIGRWLSVLRQQLGRRHPAGVWKAMSWDYLHWLAQAPRVEAEEFLNALFEQYPEVLASADGLNLLAATFKWASTERVYAWLDSLTALPGTQQAAGELLVFRHVLYPADRRTSSAVVDAVVANAGPRTVGIAHGVAHMWAQPVPRPVVHPYLLALARSEDVEVLTALAEVFRGSGFRPGAETGELLDVLTDHAGLLQCAEAERIPELLETLVLAEPDRVCKLANKILDLHTRELGDISTSWYLRSDALIGVALRLQDLAAHKSDGALLFERMLDSNLPQAIETSIALDKRTVAGAHASVPRRRRQPRR